jgi:hypothetical protein
MSTLAPYGVFRHVLNHANNNGNSNINSDSNSNSNSNSNSVCRAVTSQAHPAHLVQHSPPVRLLGVSVQGVQTGMTHPHALQWVAPL